MYCNYFNAIYMITYTTDGFVYRNNYLQQQGKKCLKTIKGDTDFSIN